MCTKYPKDTCQHSYAIARTLIQNFLFFQEHYSNQQNHRNPNTSLNMFHICFAPHLCYIQHLTSFKTTLQRSLKLFLRKKSKIIFKKKNHPRQPREEQSARNEFQTTRAATLWCAFSTGGNAHLRHSPSCGGHWELSHRFFLNLDPEILVHLLSTKIKNCALTSEFFSEFYNNFDILS